MFDISWTEFLLIGVVALIVIGPKELPAVMRTMGQWTRKVRSMAADFQGQFQEAMREAEMADLKKQVDDMAHDIKNYDPLKDVRADVEAAGKDIQTSLEQQPAPEAATTEPTSADAPVAADAGEQTVVAAPTEPDALEKPEAQMTAVPLNIEPNEKEAVAVGPVEVDAAAVATEPDSTRRAG
jgi:sec-independent protein translocase protein TatB